MDQSRSLPLSVTQEAMWVTWQLDPAKWEHIIPIALLVDGELELPRLRTAVTKLLHRHPALRARVTRGADGMCLDWSGTAPDAVPVTERLVTGTREEELAAAQRPFDLAAGPLARFEVLTGPDWTVLLVTVHHITMDGTSQPLLLDDLRRAYAGEELAPAGDIAPLVEHARRSRAAADEESGEPLRAYWREALAELPPARPLPTASTELLPVRPLTASPADTVAHPYPLTVDAELTRRLRQLARDTATSYFTVLLGALFVTLHHHTGNADLIVSAPYHGRTTEELRGRVGFFVNVLPFRQRIRPTDRYTDLLRELRTTIRAGLRHGDLPLPAILRSAGLLGPDGRQQTHQAVLQYWDSAADNGLDVFDFKLAGERGSCSVRMLDPMDVPDYRLTVMLTKGSNGTRLLWKDADGSVGPTTTTALTRDYLTVLADMAAVPDRTLAEAAALLPAVQTTPDSPNNATTKQDAPTASPATLAEVSAAWTEVLRVPDLLPEDSFFELGGHSLIAATLLARINDRLGVELTVRDLFDHPRLGALAAVVDQQRAAASAASLKRSDADGTDDAGDAAAAADDHDHDHDHASQDSTTLPASRFQEGIWLAERLDPTHARYHIPLSWRVRGELEPARLRTALARLTARHEILRTRFTDQDGRLVQEIGAPWEPELTVVNADHPDRLTDWFEEAATDFSPAAGRLLAAGLFTLPDGERILALCVHHLVLDGESVPLLLTELDRCYRQDLLSPTSQYRELLHAQQSDAGRERAAADLAYWSTALTGAPSTLGPLSPKPDPLVPATPSGSVALPLATDLTQRLKPVQEAAQASQFIVLATALAAALHRWSGQADLTFGVPVADRAGGDYSAVLGPCLNTVVLRSHCTPDTTLGDLLHATREQVIDAFEHRSAPFDELVRRLRPARTAGRTPYLDCLLNSVGTTAWSTTLGEAELTSLDHELREEAANKFGLTVTFSRHADALLGTLAYRSGFLHTDAAAELATDLAGLLNHFHDLSGERVFALRRTETS
ncbi:condensation domain-containing protein [Kitasatospora acidiphila]|uniref:condensation domain-containing protein n=1 Tax=Kitasatospora acidiphila TaxID=2567942 RepID=UPI003C707D88